jgi:uncharacterized protein YdhG (YjbR/CyaY superfamily)
MRNYQIKTVDEYIASAPKEAQIKLNEIREVIKTAVPQAEEGISWGVPFYKYYGFLAGFSAFKNHISFGFTDQLLSEDRKILEERGCSTGSKTIQIKFDQEIPVDVITQIVQAKAKINEAKKTK